MKIRGVLAAGAAAALVVVSGCGSAEQAAGGGSQQSGTQAVALSSENFVDTVAKSAYEAGSTHVEMSLDSDGQTMEGSGDFAVGQKPEDATMAMTMSMPAMGGKIELRLVDQVLYMNMGKMTQDKFAKIDLSDPDNPMGKTLTDIVGQMNPAEGVAKLDGAIESFEADGEPQQVGGVQAQPYTLVVDTQKVTKRLGGMPGAAGNLPDEMTYTYWIGPDNLPRKVTADISGVQLEMTFSEWGEDVEIDAPAKSQVTEQSPSMTPPTSPSGG